MSGDLPHIDASFYRRPPGVPDRTAAGGVVVRQDGGRLLVALVRERGLAGYVLPKGGVDAGEDLLAAARREVAEEAGLTQLTLVRKLAVQQRLTFRRTAWSTVHYFLYVTDQVEGTPTDSEYHDDVWWFPLDDLPPMIWPEQRRLLEEGRDEIAAALCAHGPPA